MTFTFFEYENIRIFFFFVYYTRVSWKSPRIFHALYTLLALTIKPLGKFRIGEMEIKTTFRFAKKQPVRLQSPSTFEQI